MIGVLNGLIWGRFQNVSLDGNEAALWIPRIKNTSARQRNGFVPLSAHATLRVRSNEGQVERGTGRSRKRELVPGKWTKMLVGDLVPNIGRHLHILGLSDENPFGQMFPWCQIARKIFAGLVADIVPGEQRIGSELAVEQVGGALQI